MSKSKSKGRTTPATGIAYRSSKHKVNDNRRDKKEPNNVRKVLKMELIKNIYFDKQICESPGPQKSKEIF
jgi:hypothetical protein